MRKVLVFILAVVMVFGSVGYASASHSAKVPYKKVVNEYVKNHGYPKGLNYIKVVEKNKKKNPTWVVYYAECDGDCYTVTVWHKKVDVFVQLN